MPEQKYAVVGCTMDGYMEAYEYVMDEFLPEHDYELAGAFHEFYPEEFEDAEKDKLYLYMPIEDK